MSGLVEQVSSILKYSAIKLFPGIFGIITLPLVISYLGIEQYGEYSILQSYTLLVVAVSSALVTQPMYRYLSSRPEDQNKFTFLAMLVSAVASIVTLLAVWVYSESSLYAWSMSLLSFIAILYACAVVLLQLEGAIAKLAFVEFLRVVTFFLIVIGAEKFGASLTIHQVIIASILSYAISVPLFFSKARIELPTYTWMSQRLLYGINGAAWLLMAGAPWIVGKVMIDSASGATALGEFSAISDVFYRGFGMINSAVVMSVFPVLAREWDSGNAEKVRRIYALGLSVYVVLCALSYLALYFFWWFMPEIFGTFDLLSGQTVVVISACIIWQVLSLTHKKAELAFKVKENTVNIAASFAIFQLLSYVLIYHSPLDSIAAVASAIIFSGFYYATKSIAFRESVHQ